MSSTPIHVLLVDDHAVVTEGLSLLLSRFDDVQVVGSAAGGAEAIARAEQLRPDLVLMDLSMPDVDGVEATRQIRSANPDVCVLALTAFLDRHLVNDVVLAGAAGYLRKSVSGDELIAAIRTVASGGSIMSAEALRLFAASSSTDHVGDDLTPREQDVLELLTSGLTNQQIAAELGLTHGTVRIYVSNILAKLGVDNRTAAAHLARNEGLVAPRDPTRD